MASARLPGGGSPIRGWRVDICESPAHIDGHGDDAWDDVGKGVGTNGEEASRGQEKIAKGLRRRLREQAEPEGGRAIIGRTLGVHAMCPSHVRGHALLAAPPPAVLSPRQLDGRRVWHPLLLRTDRVPRGANTIESTQIHTQ